MDYNKVSILGHDTLLESHPAWFEHIEVLNDAFLWANNNKQFDKDNYPTYLYVR